MKLRRKLVKKVTMSSSLSIGETKWRMETILSSWELSLMEDSNASAKVTRRC